MSGRFGVDVGGTFTDVVRISNGNVTIKKVPSTPDSPADGVIAGLTQAGFPDCASEVIAHGTTVATNAVLEREWAPTAFVTTDGFRDVLSIGRQNRPSLYDLEVGKPEPIVPRNRRFTVAERLDEEGTITVELGDESIDETVRAVANADVDAVGVCLLFSYENDVHEQQVAEALAEADPNLSIARSSTVHPEIREYERSLVTALNAALQPIMDQYLGRLERDIHEHASGATLRVMQSNGGTVTADFVRERPIDTVLSGPAAGVQGASHVASLAGYEHVVTMDMGGTSCDVAVVENGDPAISTDVTVGEYPISRPMVDVHTIGAGGGSVAWIDDGGALRVGPRSAGANPGPLCYGRGGSDPTVTDAQVALGRIDPASFPGDDIDPDPKAARDGIAAAIGDPLAMGITEAASGIVAIADANMERAIRVMTVERGLDPREFTLVAYGGAGPLHATSIARSLDIPVVLVPRAAGVLSALGLVIADMVREFSTSRVRRWDDVDPEAITAEFEKFIDRGIAQLTAEGISRSAIEIERSLDLRYAGQSFSVKVPVETDLETTGMETTARRFHERHERRYGHASPDEPLELVTLRLRVSGRTATPDLRISTENGSVSPAPTGQRRVRFGPEERVVDRYQRAELGPGATIPGPAIIDGAESTCLLHPDQHGNVDEYGTLAITPEGG